VERPIIADLGTKYFENEALQFFSDLDAAADRYASDTFLFSGSLQYLEEPLRVIDRATERGARIIALDRLLVSERNTHEVFRQRPDRRVYYSVTYPVWRFSRSLLTRQIIEKGFQLVDYFPGDSGTHFEHCGMVFVRASGNRVDI
jgi:putative methyltransferase (TIGR04325 family)